MSQLQLKPGKHGYCLIGVFLLLPACSLFRLHPDWVEPPPPHAVQHVLSGEALLGRRVDKSELPNDNLFELSPLMQATAETLGSIHRTMYAQAKALHRQLLLSSVDGGFGVQYTAQDTLPAADAFKRREVNCLSYSLMYVAMARHMGLEAQLNEVELPPSWDLRGNNSLMLLRHVNAKVTLPAGDQLVVDLEMDRYSPVYEQTLISEQTAAALFYNNRGMELVGEKRFEEGFLYLRKALELDDSKSYIWNNLGNLYYRKHLPDEAETAYLKGLSLDRRDLTVMSNLSSLYVTLDDPDKADYFQRRARDHRDNNPYYIYTQARSALDIGFIHKAQKLINKAIRKQNQEPRFYALAARIHEYQGNTEKAQAMRERAAELEKDMYL